MSGHLVIPTVNIFVLRDDKVLLGRRANTGWADGALGPPGGHIEAGETPITACIREVREELGVTISPNDLEFLAVVARNTTEGETVGYEFVMNNSSAYTFINAEPDRCSELVWVSIHDLPSDVVEDFHYIMQRSLVDKQAYIEQGYR